MIESSDCSFHEIAKWPGRDEKLNPHPSFNSIFPENYPIGIVEEVSTLPNETFHDIRIQLSTKFPQVDYIMAVENKTRVEKDSLEQNAEIMP